MRTWLTIREVPAPSARRTANSPWREVERATVRLDRLAEAPRFVAELIRRAGEFRAHSVGLREQWVFNFGRSVEVGAVEIARIADERAGIGALGVAR